MTREELRDKYQDNICETCKQMHNYQSANVFTVKKRKTPLPKRITLN